MDRLFKIIGRALPARGLLCAAVMLAGAAAARAGNVEIDAAPEGRPNVNQEWNVLAGAGVAVVPDFLGADDYDLRMVPILDIDWRRRAYFGVKRGLGVNLISTRNWRIGPRLTYDRGRDESDSALLRGLGDVDATIEAGGLIEFYSGKWRASLDLRHDIAGGHDGTRVIGGAGYGLIDGKDSVLFSGALGWASSAYLQSYYGITAAQSGTSAYGVYTPSSGLSHATVGIDWVHLFTPGWFASLNTGATMLMSQAADSPLVDAGLQFSFHIGVGLGYRF